MFIFISCKGAEKATVDNNLEEVEYLIKYEKTPCFGDCPVFSLLVDSNGDIFYHAKRNLDKTGEFTASLTFEELELLKELIKNSEFEEMAKRYPKDREIPADLPASAITFFTEKEEKRILNYGYGAPSGLLRLEEFLERIRVSKSWK
ncbi:MAG: hypothetical protein EA412_07760 [Chitinophagaceae bacterium]|nr:MAG: hypothetical protein EA412_07760 [Chitinophagaceae bacterium]